MDAPCISDMTTTHIQAHSLSSRQERKLVDYLDERFLEITGAYKKRYLGPPQFVL